MENINKKLSTIAVLGTGYVGLPIINLLAKKASIIAYDIDKKRILRLSKKIITKILFLQMISN